MAVNTFNSFIEAQNDLDRPIVQPLLTDLYQITMTYGYWKCNKHNSRAVFDLFFRRNPFHGEFTIFAGLAECLQFLKGFYYSESDVAYLKTILPQAEASFFDYLLNLTASDVVLYALEEGSLAFPRVPLMRIEGPLALCQLLETTLLTLVNFSSLVATNASRFRLAAGPNKQLLEFGLRRAQGPNGGLTASKYCYLGGFDGTSNVLAGKLFNIPIRGTHAHSFVNSFDSLENLDSRELTHKDKSQSTDFVQLCVTKLRHVCKILGVLDTETSEGELAAFISYAMAFPDTFLALVDTYDIARSGVPNFCGVALALLELGYTPLGIRLDSGDLAYHSKECRKCFQTLAVQCNASSLVNLNIVASNDINEETLHSLNQQGHSIDAFGIGTHLVTCQKQPALGCVYKLVELDNAPRIKLSEEQEKLTLPGRKQAYRLYGQDDNALVDLLTKLDEPPPKVGERVLCRHPFQESKRAWVIPSKVEPLYRVYWENGQITQKLPLLDEIRSRTAGNLLQLREDHKRALNPTPYKVSVSDCLYKFIHELWLKHAPIGELS